MSEIMLKTSQLAIIPIIKDILDRKITQINKILLKKFQNNQNFLTLDELLKKHVRESYPYEITNALKRKYKKIFQYEWMKKREVIHKDPYSKAMNKFINGKKQHYQKLLKQLQSGDSTNVDQLVIQLQQASQVDQKYFQFLLQIQNQIGNMPTIIKEQYQLIINFNNDLEKQKNKSYQNIISFKNDNYFQHQINDLKIAKTNSIDKKQRAYNIIHQYWQLMEQQPAAILYQNLNADQIIKRIQHLVIKMTSEKIYPYCPHEKKPLQIIYFSSVVSQFDLLQNGFPNQPKQFKQLRIGKKKLKDRIIDSLKV